MLFDNTGVRYFEYMDYPGMTGLLPRRLAEVATILHYDLPLKPQFKKINDFVKKRRRELNIKPINNRLKPKHYIQYLRILDAYSIGEKVESIARILFPNIPVDYSSSAIIKRISSEYTAAKKLRDDNYHCLPCL